MSFDRPTLQELIDRTAADMESRLSGSEATLRRAVTTVLARVLAGAAHHLYGYMDWAAEQVMVDTAELEHLDRWAAIWSIVRRVAEAATGSVEATGDDDSVIPAGTELQRSDGSLFTTDAEATIAGGTATLSVTASEAGADGNTAAGSELTFTSPIAGVDATATVDGDGLTGGDDAETDAALRARVLTRIRQAPHGGAYFDYETWALEVSGVTRVWVRPQHLGVGTVGIFFVCDGLDPIIPDAAKVAEVQDYLDDTTRRPVTAEVYVFAPKAVELNPQIRISPATDAVKAAVEAELTDLLAREAEPGGTILVSRIREAISVATGETDHTLYSPAADVEHATAEICVLGTITWV